MLSEAHRAINQVFAEPEEREISLLDLLIVLARHRRRILLVTAAATLLGLVLALILPNRYTSSISILPPQQGSSSTGAALMAQLGALGQIAGSSAGGALKNPNDLQVAMLKSRTVEDAMVDRFNLKQIYRQKRQSDARKKLEKYVAIENGAKDGLIRVSVTDSDPNRAAELANGYIEEFKKFSATLAVSEASQRRLFFEQQLAQAKDNLANAEEDLKRTEQETGLIQVDSQTRVAIESVAQLRAQIAAKEVQIHALRSYATAENPEVEIAEQELAALRAEQQKLGSSSDGSMGGLLIPKGIMQESSLKYVRKLRDVKYFQTIFDLLARQYESAKVDEARQGSMVQIVDKAVAPDRRSSPKPTYILPAAALVGLILGICWAFATEGLIRLSHNPAERSRLDTLRSTFASQANRQTVR